MCKSVSKSSAALCVRVETVCAIEECNCKSKCKSVCRSKCSAAECTEVKAAVCVTEWITESKIECKQESV